MSLDESSSPPAPHATRLCRKGESVLANVPGKGWLPGKIAKNGKERGELFSIVALDSGDTIRLARSGIRSARVRKDHSAHKLDEDTSLRTVERELRSKKMLLTVTQDEDGYMVTLVQNNRRYLGLSQSLTEAFKEAFDDAGST